MPSYRLTWTIDLDADDAVSAARKARRYQLDPHAQVGVFEVADKDFRVEKVDLDEQDGDVEEGRAINTLPTCPVLSFQFEALRKLEGEEALLGVVHIFGVLHHAWFVRVEETHDDQVAIDDPYNRLQEFQQLDAAAGRLRTIEVPGFPGQYVLVIYPGGA
jgi:hypothetical protein